VPNNDVNDQALLAGCAGGSAEIVKLPLNAVGVGVAALFPVQLQRLRHTHRPDRLAALRGSSAPLAAAHRADG